jgi:3-phenylpropionate/cinnamic acid dioxygenase small subunit
VTVREDHQDITELILRYATAIDRREWSLFGTIFTDDAELDYGEVGKWRGADEVAQFMEQAHATARYTMHRLTNPVISVDDDQAEARTYIDALIIVADDQSGVNAVGFYDDRLVRTDEGWRINRRMFTPVRVTTVGT